MSYVFNVLEEMWDNVKAILTSKSVNELLEKKNHNNGKRRNVIDCKGNGFNKKGCNKLYHMQA